MSKIYDTIIVGGGPAGYTAALYGARAGLSILVIEKNYAGGQTALTHQIDNYPGFELGIDGLSLSEKMKKQAERFGIETINAEVTSLNLQGEIKKVHTLDTTLEGKTVIIATGATPRKLGVPNETEMTGKGVSYCAACDGMFYKDKTVLVIGGGNSAIADALILSRIAKKVIIIHRRDSFRATKIYDDLIFNTENIEVRWNSKITKLNFDSTINGVNIVDVKSGQELEISCDGIFVSVGREPASNIVKGQLDIDDNGYIIADETCKTNLSGVYAIGDIRTKELRQIVTAVSDGANAIHSIESYFEKVKR